MLKDRFFYPIAVVLIASMIWFALSRAKPPHLQRVDICKSGYAFKGEDLIQLVASPGTNYDYFASQNTKAAYVKLYSHIPRDKAPASAGVFAPIPSQYAQLFQGKTIRLTIKARLGRKDPLESFDAGYFSLTAGATNWKSFDLTDGFQDYSFEFTPSKAAPSEEVDYFGIWPGVEGEQKTMDVETMQIQIISGCP